MAEHQLPKLSMRVRFPSSAPSHPSRLQSFVRHSGHQALAQRKHCLAHSGEAEAAGDQSQRPKILSTRG